jgi:heptosyltransferase-1
LELAAAAIAFLGGNVPPGGPVLFPLPAGRPETSLPASNYFLTTPAAGWVSKQWPLEHFVRLAEIISRETGSPLVVDCAPGDLSLAGAIVDRAPRGACRLHVSSLEGLIAATRRARAVVGVDSGPLHLAAALGIPGVAIYGRTDPARNGPYGPSFRVLRSSVAVTSYARQRAIDPAMEEITPQQVWEALREQLAEHGG